MLDKIKIKKCCVCRNGFLPFLSTAKVCSTLCAINYATAKREAKERKELKQAKAKIKTRAEHLKECQFVFNKFIRLRDEHEPCISCGRFHKGQYHAGHYRTIGSAPHLRFDEQNVNKQCAPCNNHLSGNIINYRQGLIKKIGMEALIRLESDNAAKHYAINDILEIKNIYKQKINVLTHVMD